MSATAPQILRGKGYWSDFPRGTQINLQSLFSVAIPDIELAKLQFAIRLAAEPPSKRDSLMDALGLSKRTHHRGEPAATQDYLRHRLFEAQKPADR
jgi:hypothetical protein